MDRNRDVGGGGVGGYRDVGGGGGGLYEDRGMDDDDHGRGNAEEKQSSLLQVHTPYQHTLSIHPINTPYQYTLSIHPINTPYQHTLSIHPINTLYRSRITNLILSYRFIDIPY